jgi:hypothetical protein
MNAGHSLPVKQIAQYEFQLEENERLVGMKYNLVQDQFGHVDISRPRIKDV